MVVAKFASLPNAAANSVNVSNAAGAELIIAATALAAAVIAKAVVAN